MSKFIVIDKVTGKARIKSIANRSARRQQRDKIRENMLKYDALYLFSFKDVRRKIMLSFTQFPGWEDSEVLFGRNDIVYSALQYFKTVEPNWPDLENLQKLIKGQVALLFTNRSQAEVEHWFDMFTFWDYPFPGFQVDDTIKVQRGPIRHFQPAIAPYLRQLGMPVKVRKGVVLLTQDFVLCEAGTILCTEQVYLLQLLGEKLSVFKFTLKAKWTKHNGLVLLSDVGIDDMESENGDMEYESDTVE